MLWVARCAQVARRDFIADTAPPPHTCGWCLLLPLSWHPWCESKYCMCVLCLCVLFILVCACAGKIAAMCPPHPCSWSLGLFVWLCLVLCMFVIYFTSVSTSFVCIFVSYAFPSTLRLNLTNGNLFFCCPCCSWESLLILLCGCVICDVNIWHLIML